MDGPSTSREAPEAINCSTVPARTIDEYAAFSATARIAALTLPPRSPETNRSTQAPPEIGEFKFPISGGRLRITG
uniref:Uncharacterized protein n=1 Tax=Pristionchus pacificus TaxID=54126 RepID=A0A2A6BIU2_PRIPA|eukprot:PDM65748.1 hypothetical protein PRIPAC_45149 [Pristionchus pacificus]